jgi:PIN domain nuclease of toxin-antitoxin system
MGGDKRLGPKAKELLALPDTALSISLLTLFEIELKRRINKLDLQSPISEFLDTFGIEVYSPTASELADIMSVKLNHSDPFDCALVGLAKLKDWVVMTSDDPLLKKASDLVTMIDSEK